MNFRPFRTLAAIAVGAAIALGSAGAYAQEKKVLRFSTAGPPADFLARSLVMFKEEVEKTAPTIEVQVYPASQLFRQGAEVPALQRGNLEMSTMTTFEIAQQIAEFGFFNRAFLFREFDHMMKVMKGPIGERYYAAVADKMGLVILAPTYLGTRQLNLRAVREVKGPDDLKGVKLRMPAGPDWLLLGQALGVAPTPLAMPEVYLALQTGSIDGQENPLTIMNAAKYHEVTKQVVLTSHLVQPVFFTVAKPFYDKLTDAEKAAVRAAAVKAADWNANSRFEDEKNVAEKIKSAGLTVSEIDLAPFRASADRVYSEAEKKWNVEMMKEVMAVE